jgi:hypothetical protein
MVWQRARSGPRALGARRKIARPPACRYTGDKRRPVPLGHCRDLGGAAKQRLACCPQYGIPAARSAPGQPQKNCTGEGVATGNLQVSFVRPSSVQAVALVGSTILLTGLGGGVWPSVIRSIVFARQVGRVTLPLP